MFIRRKIGLLPIVFIAMALLLVSGCTGASYALLDPSPGKVQGTVLNEDAQPERNVNIRLENTVSSSANVLTDADGKFSLPEVSPGIYDLVAEKRIDGIEYRARIRYINVSEEALIMRDLILRPAGRISGRVLLEGTNNYSGVSVQLLGTQKSFTTNADGTYIFDDLAYSYRDHAAGIDYRYTLRFTKDLYSIRTVDGITVSAGEVTIIPDVTLDNLDPAGIADISGLVRLEARTGAEGAKIRLLGTDISEEIISSNSSMNTFIFRNIPVGSYVIEVRHDDYYKYERQFTISPGQTSIDLGALTLTNVSHFSADKKAVDMVLSPASRQIAYGRYEPDNSDRHREIYVMDIEGSNFDTKISYLARVAENRGMSWSADGKYLLYVEYRADNVSRRYRLQVIPSSGGANQNTNLTNFIFDLAQPAFAPDNHRLVWLEYDDDPSAAGIMAAELVKKTSGLSLENRAQVIPISNDIVANNQFSSIEFGASDRILFCKDNNTSSIGTGYGINTVPVNAAGNAGLMFPVLDGGRANAVTYGPFYDRIAYAISSGADAGIYMANLDGTARERISEAYGWALNISSDGKMIYFIDKRTAYNWRIARLKIPQKWWH